MRNDVLIFFTRSETRPNRPGGGKVSKPTIDRWFDVSAFSNPAPFTFGTSGVNILRQDELHSLDISMGKNFYMTESRYVQLRSEFFNFFNRPNFGATNANINQPAQESDIGEQNNLASSNQHVVLELLSELKLWWAQFADKVDLKVREKACQLYRLSGSGEDATATSVNGQDSTSQLCSRVSF